MQPPQKWKVIATTCVAALSILSLFYVFQLFNRNDLKDNLSSIPSGSPTSSATPSKLGQNITSKQLQPGETRPGKTPGTVLVQPFQPGPPKEISRNYRVPTHLDDARISRTEDGRIIFEQAIELANKLHSTNTPFEEDVHILDSILGYYRMIYNSNPVAGENFEVINCLTGKNRQKVVVFPINHPDLDDQGNLVDRWGTPYFFHAISATQLDIQSAGPDRERGSQDDIKLGYRLPESD